MITLLPGHKSNVQKAIDITSGERVEELSNANLSVRSDDCSPMIFDILDSMFAIDGRGFDVEERRHIIKTAFKVHQYQGTVYALRVALEGLFEKFEIVEFEELPYTFGIDVKYDSMKEIDTIIKKALVIINQAKNVRSNLRSIELKPPINIADMNIVSGIKFRI